MSEPSINLVCVGNALVDVLTHCSEEFIKEQEKNGVIKGSMMLIDKDRAEELYSAMPKTIEISGGSAANTITAFASFGGKGAYIGKVAKDELGEVFINDMKSMGVTYNTQPLIIGETTGRCLIMVTPDAQRTMNTYLGAATELHPADIDADLINLTRSVTPYALNSVNNSNSENTSIDIQINEPEFDHQQQSPEAGLADTRQIYGSYLRSEEQGHEKNIIKIPTTNKTSCGKGSETGLLTLSQTMQGWSDLSAFNPGPGFYQLDLNATRLSGKQSQQHFTDCGA